MNLQQLFELTPERVDRDLYGLNEILDCQTAGAFLSVGTSDRLYQKVIKDHRYDHRRSWYLSILMFDDEPVAVIRLAGRERRDHRSVLPIGIDEYIAACQYLDSLACYEDYTCGVPIKPDQDISTFYGQSLEELV
jgi:hypothetical protein